MKAIALFSLLGATLATGASSYVGNFDAGFGGSVGFGLLDLDDDGTTLSAEFTRGIGSFNDALVIYIDSVAGGDNDTSGYTDQGDPLRTAISGVNGADTSTLTFPAGFGADYVVAFDNGFAGLWQLSTGGSHSFIADLGLSPTGSATATSYSLDLTLADIGLTPAPGESFDFVTTYTSGTAFRSTESLGNNVSGTQGYNPFTSGATQTYTLVPEPSTALLGLLGGAFLIRRRR